MKNQTYTIFSYFMILVLCTSLFSDVGFSEESIKMMKEFSVGAWSMGIATFENNIFVANGIGNKIYVLDNNGNFIRDFYLKDQGCSGHIHGIDVFDQKIYVAKENNDCVGIYDLNGELLNVFGKTGNKNGEFNSPQNLEIYENKIFVVDSINHRIQIFDNEGQYVDEILIQGDDIQIFDIEIFDQKIFVSVNTHFIQIFDLNGQFIDEFGSEGSKFGQFQSPFGIEIKNEMIFVSDIHNNRIQIFDINGNFLYEIKSDFKGPHQSVLLDDKLFVLDTYNFKVKIFQLPIQLTNSNPMYYYFVIIFVMIILLFVYLIKFKKII